MSSSPSRHLVLANREGTRREPGQSLVEFAILLPILLLLTLGVIDVARVFSSWVALTNGVREAALYASEPPNYTNQATINSRVLEEASGLDAARLTIAWPPVCDGGACDETSSTVTINVTYQMDLLVPMVQTLLGDPVTMGATATAPIIDHSQ